MIYFSTFTIKSAQKLQNQELLHDDFQRFGSFDEINCVLGKQYCFFDVLLDYVKRNRYFSLLVWIKTTYSECLHR